MWQLSKVHTLRSGSAWPADSSVLGGSSLPFGRPKRCKNLRSGTAGTLFVSWGFKPAVWQPSRVHKLRSSTAQPAHSSFLGGSSLPFGRPKRCKNLRSGTAGTLFVSWGLKPAIWQLSKVHTLRSGSARPAGSSFLAGSSLPFGRLKRCKSFRSGTAGTLFVSWGFKPAIWQLSKVHTLRPKRCKNLRSTAGTLFVSRADPHCCRKS